MTSNLAMPEIIKYEFRVLLPEDDRDEKIEKLINHWKEVKKINNLGVEIELDAKLTNLWKSDSTPPQLSRVLFRWNTIRFFFDNEGEEKLLFVKDFIKDFLPDYPIQTHTYTTYDLKAAEIFEKEDEEHRDGYQYSTEEQEAIEKMERFIENHTLDYYLIQGGQEHHPNYMKEKWDFIQSEKKRRKEGMLFPFPDFCIQPDHVFLYANVATFLYPDFRKQDEYSVFFGFKLRNLPITEIRHFLNYLSNKHGANFLDFLEDHLVEYDYLYNEKSLRVIQKWIENQKKVKKENIGMEVSKNKQKSEFTNAQWALIGYYGMKGLGIEIRSNIDMTDMAKFIHLIARKPLNSTIKNTEIYKRIRVAPTVNQSNDKTINDLKKVRGYFAQFGLEKAVNSINEDIEKERNHKREKK